MSLKIPQTDPFISITQTRKSYLTHSSPLKETFVFGQKTIYGLRDHQSSREKLKRDKQVTTTIGQNLTPTPVRLNIYFPRPENIRVRKTVI